MSQGALTFGFAAGHADICPFQTFCPGTFKSHLQPGVTMRLAGSLLTPRPPRGSILSFGQNPFALLQGTHHWPVRLFPSSAFWFFSYSREPIKGSAGIMQEAESQKPKTNKREKNSPDLEASVVWCFSEHTAVGRVCSNAGA